MNASDNPTYGPLVKVCRAHGIGKTKAYELAKAGLLRTAQIGKRRYVYLESIRTLPQRLEAGKNRAP